MKASLTLGNNMATTTVHKRSDSDRKCSTLLERSVSWSLFLLLGAQAACLPAPAMTLKGRLEVVSEAAPSKAPAAPLLDSFPQSYEGIWRCLSTVVDSGVGTIAVGQISTCEIQFKKQSDGRVTANWSQPGWTEAESTPQSFSAEKARVDRTNYYWADGVQGAWAARSRDDFNLVDNETILAKSYVDQYIDGQYMGRYRTKSVLKRVPPTEGLAGAFKANLFGSR